MKKNQLQKKVVILVAVLLWHKNKWRLAVFSYTHTHTVHIGCVRYITYIHTPHTHTTWAPEGKLMKTLHKEPFDSFITKVLMTVLMEIFIIFWLLPNIILSLIKRGVSDVKVWKRKWECGKLSDDWGATAFT